MLKRALFVCAVVAGLAGLGSTSARAVTVKVDAKDNSSSDGIGGAATGLFLTAGQVFTVTVALNDLWNAGPLPRWSNANGLIAPLDATGTDDSAEPAGTPIGSIFPFWDQNNLSAPYGSLVGELGGVFFFIGTNFSGPAIASGPLSLYYWDSNS